MKTITLTDHSGNCIGSFVFDPSSPGLTDRMDTLRRRVSRICNSLAHANIRADGTGAGLQSAILVAIAEKRLFEVLDECLHPVNSSSELFKIRRPFASVQGKFFCSQIIPQIEKYL